MANRWIDPVERAHLRDAAGFSPPVHRFAPSPALTDLVRRYWMPVWSMPAGESTTQRVLQYPVCLIVLANSYASFIGLTTGLSTRTLTGQGWAFGVMLQPAAGALLLGASVSEITYAAIDLDHLTGMDGGVLTEQVRSAVGDAPSEPAAAAAVEDALAAAPPVDEEGLLVNAVVDYVEDNSHVQRVGQMCEKFAISERSLQRLTARRVGLSPKWLIQRRRLHEAAAVLKTGKRPDLARVAAELGYCDQAHFGRDFRAVTGLTPGEYAAEPRHS
ncbi:MAG: helix-turn-helix domain-containing protein [Actinomycetota bacterium]|nr:helix-turn-helix domain-containing protein [Actinomycetota bacterium]